MVAVREPVLCYVEGSWAYFTTQDLEKQWGDDWNDAPYDCNAGSPYAPYGKDEHWEITRVAFDVNLDAPCEGVLNCRWSVEDINAGKVPWLRSPDYAKESVRIMAGTPLLAFIEVVQQNGGRVYMEVPPVAAQEGAG